MPSDRTPGARPGSSKSARWLPPVVWAGLILVGTSWPSISVGPDVIIGFDKVVHFGMYGVLTVLVMRALRPPHGLAQSLLILVALAAFGAADEWHQAFIPGRSGSIYDWIADTLGVITGLIASRYNLPASAKPDGTGSPNPDSTS